MLHGELYPLPLPNIGDGLQALIDQGFENASNVFTIQKLNTQQIYMKI